MGESASPPKGLSRACLLLTLLAITACGTLEIAPVEPGVTPESPTTPTISTEPPEPTPAILLDDTDVSEIDQAVAWYGTIHSVAGGEAVADYLKPWHLNIWPKFGPAVGIIGADPAIDSEIERLRDTDTKATIWGQLSCGASTYGPCQLLVTRLSADDGGPRYAPDQIDGWEGTVGRLPAQPGSQNDALYFVLAGEIPVLYGLSSSDPLIQEELQTLPDAESTVRIWGELNSKARPVTGTLIDVKRLEIVSPS